MPLDSIPAALEACLTKFDTSPAALRAAAPWYAVVSKPGAERQARFHLAEQGYEVYLPMCRELVRHAGRAEEKEKPLLTRYLFVEQDKHLEIEPIRFTPGVQFLMRSAARAPLTLSAAVIAGIKAREGGDGVIDLTPKVAELRYRPGQPLRVVGGGPFVGFQGLFQKSAKARVTVLLGMFGRDVEVELDEAEVEAVK